MPVPFGTRVVDKNGKGVGTVSRVVLHSGSRQASGLVVHQGVLDRRQIVVPIAKVSSFGDEVRLTLSASDLAGLDLYNAESLQLMPDQWEMPVGFDPTTQKVEYSAGAMLLDPADPSRVLARTAVPILEPETDDERSGTVPNVVFPTAVEEVDGVRFVFYGMADSKIGVARLDRT